MRKMKNSNIEWIGDVPNNWIVERLQWHLYEINVKNNPIQTTNVLSLTNKKGVIPYEEKGAQGNISKENYSEYHLAYEDTIVANSMNILIGSVGYSKYFGCVSPVYYVFKEKENNDLRFLNYIMQTPQFQKELRKYANGILEIRLRVSSSDILKRMAAFPASLEEQIKIADFLDLECQKIENLCLDIEEQITLLDEYKRTVINEAVTLGLNRKAQFNNSNIDYIGIVPPHWKIKRLKYILKERNEKSIEGKEELLSVSQYFGVIPSSENKMRTMQANSLIGYKKVYKGDLVFNKLNPGLARFGYSPYEGITSPDFAVYIPDERIINAKFLLHVLKSPSYVALIKSLASGVGDGFARLYTPQLFTFMIAIPPLEELNDIIEYLDKKCSEIDAIIAAKKSQLDTLEEYKKSLIYEYVTGKKEVPNE